jgi:HSP20 family protein
MSGMSLFPYYPTLRPMARTPWEGSQFPLMRRDLEQMLAEFFGAAAPPGARQMQTGASPGMMLMPHIDVAERDREIRITAELPGITPDDVSVTLDDGVLVIRGEKKAEQHDSGTDLHVLERTYGTFSRYLRLPFSVDPSKVEASFKDGVLTIVVPKPEQMQAKSNRIEIKKEAANPATGNSGQTAAKNGQAKPAGSKEAAAV